MDRFSALKGEREEGHRKGLEEGRKEGRHKGRLVARINLLEQLLGERETVQSELLKLELARLGERAEQLRQHCDKRN